MSARLRRLVLLLSLVVALPGCVTLSVDEALRPIHRTYETPKQVDGLWEAWFDPATERLCIRTTANGTDWCYESRGERAPIRRLETLGETFAETPSANAAVVAGALDAPLVARAGPGGPTSLQVQRAAVVHLDHPADSNVATVTVSLAPDRGRPFDAANDAASLALDRRLVYVLKAPEGTAKANYRIEHEVLGRLAFIFALPITVALDLVLLPIQPILIINRM